MIARQYSHLLAVLLAFALGPEVVLAANSSSSSVDVYVYTLTYTTSGQTYTSVCQDWENDMDDFHTLPACPGTDPDATTTSDSGISYTLRNYSSLTTSVASTTTAVANLTTRTISGASTTSASVTSADISGGTASGSAASSTSSSTSSASASAGRLFLHLGYLVLFSGVYTFLI